MAYPGLVLAIIAGVAVGSMLYYLFAAPSAEQQYNPPLRNRALPAPPPRSRQGSNSARRRKLRSNGRKSSEDSITGGRDNIDDCSICCDNLFNGESKPIELPCSHYFHITCIKKWLPIQRNCPNCKKSVGTNLVL